MASVYDRTDIYDLFDSPKKDAQTLSHWQAVFNGRPIRSALDVSIGTGSLTLPLGQLGVSLYGSDLSDSMLARCRKKADERGIAIDLRQSDFRDLTSHFDRSFDCVMSTGNSLAYVTNNEITGVLEQMDALVEPGGCLYFDLRNWDRIVGQKKRFYCYNPAFLPNGDRVNLMQVWDHLSDGSIVFNLVYTFERDNKIFQKERFEEHYHPVPQKLLLDKLTQLGYQDIQVKAFPVQFGAFDIENSEWYCVLAHCLFPQKGHDKKVISRAAVNAARFNRRKTIMDGMKNISKAEVLTLRDQVAYQSGQVVSRTLAQNEHVSVTLFSFDKGEEISTHESGGDAMVTCLDGVGRITIDGVEHILHEGESIVMPARHPHAVYGQEQFKMLLVVVF
mgnify:CR=1 FL=1